MTLVERQLEQYAEDFQELVGRHFDLERRYENLKTTHARLAQAGEHLGALSDAVDTSDGLHQGALVFDAEGQILGCDAAFCAVSGYAEADILGYRATMIEILDADKSLLSTAFWESLVPSGVWRGEVLLRTASGQRLRHWLSLTAAQDRASQSTVLVGALLDREKLLSAERALVDVLYHDPLTGLPSLELFRERVEKKFAAAARDTAMTLLSIQLDRDQWREQASSDTTGETVLMAASERLREVIRGCDEIARTADDRFVVLLHGARTEQEVSHIASDMVRVLTAPVQVRRQLLTVQGSIGCALFPQDGRDLATLMAHAEIAREAASDRGGNRYCIYRHQPSEPEQSLATLLGDLERDDLIPLP